MTKHVTPPTSGPVLSGYSANENAGDTTQIRGTKNPTQARTKSPVSSGVFRLAATLTLRLPRPGGARMTTITSVAASTSAFATHGFMAEHRPVLHRTAASSMCVCPANTALELRARPHHAKPPLVSSKRLLGGCSRRLYLQGMSCAATICQTPARLSQVSVHTKQDFSS